MVCGQVWSFMGSTRGSLVILLGALSIMFTACLEPSGSEAQQDKPKKRASGDAQDGAPAEGLVLRFVLPSQATLDGLKDGLSEEVTNYGLSLVAGDSTCADASVEDFGDYKAEQELRHSVDPACDYYIRLEMGVGRVVADEEPGEVDGPNDSDNKDNNDDGDDSDGNGSDDGNDETDAGDSGGDQSSTAIAYEGSGGMKQLLDQHCTSCHRPGGSQAAQDLSRYRSAAQYADRSAIRVSQGTMPPGAPLSQKLKDQFRAWADSGTPEKQSNLRLQLVPDLPKSLVEQIMATQPFAKLDRQQFEGVDQLNIPLTLRLPENEATENEASAPSP